jgi:hypothetical protein
MGRTLATALWQKEGFCTAGLIVKCWGNRPSARRFFDSGVLFRYIRLSYVNGKAAKIRGRRDNSR